jgi:hypothetical protein
MLAAARESLHIVERVIIVSGIVNSRVGPARPGSLVVVWREKLI